MSLGSVGSSSTKTTPTPSKVETSGGSAAKAAPAAKSSDVKFADNATPAAAPTDKVTISDKAKTEQAGMSSALMSGLEDAYGADDAKKVEENAEADPENPYSDMADYSVKMKPEPWSKDRTPAEGDVARNDHLEGMLRNQGYELNDIYSKGPDGKTMLERVAEENGLANPDLITPEQELVLPSRREPPMTDNDIQADELDGKTIDQKDYAEGDGAVAETKVEAGVIADTTIDQQPVAVGDDTEANAGVKADTIDSSVVRQSPVALGDGAEAKAEVEADTIRNSEIDQAPVAVGDGAEAKAEVKAEDIQTSVIDQMPMAAGEGAEADAGVKAGTIDSSVVRQSPVALGDGAQAQAELEAEAIRNSVIDQSAVAVGDDAEAQAKLKAEEVEDSTLSQQVAAQGDGAEADAAVEIDKTTGEVVLDRTVEAQGEGAQAKTETVVGENDGQLTITDEAAADGQGAGVEQGTLVEDNKGDLSVALDGSATGPDGTVRQDLIVGGDGQTDVEMKATGDSTEQYAEGSGEGTAVVVSEGAAHPKQEITGFDNVKQVQVGADGAIMGTDATNAEYVGEADSFANIMHEGRDGHVQLDVSSGDRVYFGDGMENGGAYRVDQSGNDIDGTVAGRDVRIQADSAKSLDLQTVGTEGDDRHEVIGPDGMAVVSDLRGGKDALSIQADGTSSNYVEKTSGELGLYGKRDGAAEVAVSGGEAVLTGDMRMSSDDDKVYLQTETGGHSLRTNGGDGTDVLVIDLKGDAPVPKIVTKEAGWVFGREEGQTPDGWSETDGTITALDYESIVIRRDGEVISNIGDLPADLASFEEVAARIKAEAAQ